ncbi:ATP-dependent DNA ligase [Amycolatopsis sp. NPDC005003]
MQLLAGARLDHTEAGQGDDGRLREGPDWVYEYKLDSYRACMQIAPDGTTVLTSGIGIDFTHGFANLAGILAPALDGETVVCNEAGQIDFGLLQERCGRYQAHRSSPRRSEPFDDVLVRFPAFDLLQLGTTSLLRQPYGERRRLLTSLAMPDPYRISVVRGYTFTELVADRRTLQDLLDHVAATGHEGLVTKQDIAWPDQVMRTKSATSVGAASVQQTPEGIVVARRRTKFVIRAAAVRSP